MTKLDTWTISVKMTVFAGDMTPEQVEQTAQVGLEKLCDGSDFMSIDVFNVERDEL